MNSIYKHSDPSIAKVLVGNKIDLEQDRKTPKHVAQKLASEHGMEYFETSAKENKNITEVINYILDKVYENLYAHSNNDDDIGKKSVVLKKNGTQNGAARAEGGFSMG